MKWMEARVTLTISSRGLWGRSDPATKYLVKNSVKLNMNNPKPGFTS